MTERTHNRPAGFENAEYHDHRGEVCAAPHSSNCEYAAAAAEKAVKKTFAILGVDVDQPFQVAEFQEDLRFGRKVRRAADHSVLIGVAAIVIMLLAALGVGLKQKITGG